MPPNQRIVRYIFEGHSFYPKRCHDKANQKIFHVQPVERLLSGQACICDGGANYLLWSEFIGRGRLSIYFGAFAICVRGLS